jgi:hypothetical protein
MTHTNPAGLRVLRTASIRLRVTRRQADRCYGLLRSGGDVWAWLIDTNRQRQHEGSPPVVSYQALCRELTGHGSFGELSAVGARSILRRYSSAWLQAAKRRRRGENAGFPRRKRALVPVNFHHGTSSWMDSGCACQLPRGMRSSGSALLDPSPIQPSRSAPSRCSRKEACCVGFPKPGTRRFHRPHCNYQAHRDLVGAANIAAKASGGGSSAALPAHVEHRRVGTVPTRRDRRRHLHDQRRRRSCLASGRVRAHCATCRRRSPHATFPLQAAGIEQRGPSGHTLLEGALTR